MQARRHNAHSIIAMKRRGERIASITAYDYTSAQMLDAAGIPLILVGDTVGMVVQGEDTTLGVSMQDMLYHSRMVARGCQRALVVCDLPFMSYQVSVEEALKNAGRLISQGRAGAVKLEGGAEMAPIIRRLVQAGIPVCGHLGFTPQSTHVLGGPRVQGREPDRALSIIADAEALEAAGAFAIVLELVPASIALEITRRLSIPTIGIGSGPECDGEVQVFHDLFGLYTDFQPRHTRRYLNVAADVVAAARQFASDVAARTFPGREQTSDLSPEAMATFQALLRTAGGAPIHVEGAAHD